MQSNIKNIDSGTIELTVELSKDDLVKYVKGAEQEFSQQVSVDGFRKGKAPQELVKQRLNPQQVLEAALQSALQDSLTQAIQEHDLDVLKSRNLKVQENTAEQLKYSVTLNIAPKFALPDLTKVRVQRREVTVDDKEINEALESIRSMRSQFIDKEGAAIEGDRVEIDFEVKQDGKIIEGGESKNHPLIIGKKQFIPGFEDQLVDMKPGEEKQFSLVAPKDYFHKEIAGKKLDFTVKLVKLQTVKLPELSDELAKTIGVFTNVDQLKGSVREGVYEEKRGKEKQRLRLEILDRIISDTKLEVPEYLVNEQLDYMVGNFDADLHAKGMELAMYLAHVGKTQDDLRKDWRKDAERQAKIVLILHEVARQKSISVNEEEIGLAVNDTLQALVSRGATDLSTINTDAVRGDVAERLVNEKTLDFLEGIAVRE